MICIILIFYCVLRNSTATCQNINMSIFPPDWHETYIDRKLLTSDYFEPLVHGTKFKPEDGEDPLDFCRWKCATTHKCVAWNPPLDKKKNLYCLLYKWAEGGPGYSIQTNSTTSLRRDQKIKPTGKAKEPTTVFNWAYLLKPTKKGEEFF